MEREKQNKHGVCNKDNNCDNDVDIDSDNGDDSVDNDDDGSDDGAAKHLTHLSQAADYCLIGRSKQNKHVICNKDNDVDYGDNDSVDNGDGDGAENGVDGVDN
eukprot:4598901-Ditylum_brightwellii.AAC.1